MADIMEPGRRRVEIADLFSAYADACEARGKRPIPANQFPAEVAALCNQVGIELEDTGDGVYLRKVKLRRQAGRKAG